MLILQCPFHGVIVPRDVMGRCVNPEDELKVKGAEEEKKVPDWQDPELLKDIEVCNNNKLHPLKSITYAIFNIYYLFHWKIFVHLVHTKFVF